MYGNVGRKGRESGTKEVRIVALLHCKRVTLSGF
jgi:hypothetical protein